MTYLITYTTPFLAGPHHDHWVCRPPVNAAKALESFKTRHTSATVLAIAECAGREVEA